MERYKQVNLKNDFKFYDNCPIDILKSAIYIDTLTDNAVFQIKFINMQTKKIKAIYIQVKGYDDLGKELENKEYSYLDLNISKGVDFGTRELKELKNNTIRNLEISINKVIFENNEIWIKDNSSGYDRIDLEQMNIENSSIARKKLKTSINENLVYPIQTENYWTCICGVYNSNNNDKCFRCNNKKETIFSEFSKNTLEQNLKEYKEKLKQEQEKSYKKSKKIFLGVILILVICFSIMLCLEIPKHDKNVKYQLFNTDGYYALINKSGYVVELAYSKKENITEIFDLDMIEIREQEKITGEYEERFKNFCKILKIAENNGLNNVSSIGAIKNSKAEYEYNLEIESENKQIHIGNLDNLDKKFKYIKSMLEQEKGKHGDIDVSNIEKVYFREK